MTTPRTVVAAAAAIATTVCAAPAAGAQEVRPPGSDAPLGNELLSNETTITRWANATSRGRVWQRPSGASRAVATLRLLTEDRLPEVYLVLASHVDGQGRVWLRVRVPRRPNGATGWVLADWMSELQLVRTKLRVNRTTLRATLFRKGRPIWQSRIGVGKRSTPTPAGHFWIRERLRNLGGDPLYGRWAFGTSAYSGLSEWPGGGVIGIHGTNQPQLIPGRPSHGCIRVPNDKMARLARLMPVGTPVEIVGR